MKTLSIEILNPKAINLLLDMADLDLIKIDQEFSLLDKNKTVEGDFFELAGIWKDKEISLNKIREKSWPIRE